MEGRMIWMKLKDIPMHEGIRYCAVCWFNNNTNKFSYYSIPHETKKGFVKRVVNTIRHEFNLKPEII